MRGANSAYIDLMNQVTTIINAPDFPQPIHGAQLAEPVLPVEYDSNDVYNKIQYHKGRYICMSTDQFDVLPLNMRRILLDGEAGTPFD